jgi:hypothetical protein
MADFAFQVKEVERDGYIAWDAIEIASGRIIPQTKPLKPGQYPEIQDYLSEAHGIETSISYDPIKGDALVGLTWTFVRERHKIIIHEIPRTVLRVSGRRA